MLELLIGGLVTFGLLVLIQAVLGLDNVLIITMESKKAPKGKQSMVRKWGIGIAIIMRIALLFFLVSMVEMFDGYWFHVDESWFHLQPNLRSTINFGGGMFVLYTAIKDIMALASFRDLDEEDEEKAGRSTGMAIAYIVLLNVIFSVDSILSAMALTDNLWIMAAAIVTGGLVMIFMADKVARFLERNRTYEVLGLFILLIVGVMLVLDGAHLAHVEIFGYPIQAMSKPEFYFVISMIILVELVESRFEKKLKILKERKKID